MKLSERLLSIVQFIQINSIVGDIGTDHGYLPIYLIDNNISKRVIATDISKNSLKKIQDLVIENGLGKYIETRLGNGLEVIKPFEIDTLVVAGMGGNLIIDILDSNIETRDSINSFILQPNVGSSDLRKYLINNNFIIMDEDIAIEKDKYYQIIYAKKGKSSLSEEIFYEIGEALVNKRDDKLRLYLENRIDNLKSILLELEGVNTLKVEERIKNIESEILDLKKVLKKIES